MAAAEEGELVQRLRPGDRDARAVALVLALQLARGSQGVMYDDDSAQEHCAQDSDGVLRAIRHDEGNPVSGSDPGLMECSSAAAHVLGELGVGELACEKVDGGAPRVARSDLQNHLRDGALGGCNLVGNTGRVQAAQLRREVHLSSFGNDIPTIP